MKITQMEQVQHGHVYAAGPGGTAFYRAEALSALPGFAHGFATRAGGISPAPAAGLNMHWDEAGLEPDVWANYHTFALGGGFSFADMTIVSHEHGVNVLRVDTGHRGRGFANPPLPPCDGIITNQPGIVLVTSHADCGAFFMIDPKHRAVGLAHAGWRGTLGGIGRVMAGRMACEFGTDPADIIAATGPCICGHCFEVDEPLADTFVNTFNCPALKRPGKPGKAYVDLQLAAVCQFIEAGILPAHITCMDACTFENPAHFFSYRREGKGSGSMAAYITIAQDHHPHSPGGR